MSCSQIEEACELAMAGHYVDASLAAGVIEYAKTHEEIKGETLTFQKDADQIYAGWKEKLGYTSAGCHFRLGQEVFGSSL